MLSFRNDIFYYRYLSFPATRADSSPRAWSRSQERAGANR